MNELCLVMHLIIHCTISWMVATLNALKHLSIYCYKCILHLLIVIYYIYNALYIKALSKVFPTFSHVFFTITMLHICWTLNLKCMSKSIAAIAASTRLERLCIRCWVMDAGIHSREHQWGQTLTSGDDDGVYLTEFRSNVFRSVCNPVKSFHTTLN